MRAPLSSISGNAWISRLRLIATAATVAMSPACRGDEVVRIMAANTTSGNLQSYDPGEGIRIFQGLDPDIVLVQEFNFGGNDSASIRQFVDRAFGSDFDYYREGGGEQIPNGVISRYPIRQSGEWTDSEVGNRDFAWARIDIPGDRDLWAVSVHFLTSNASDRNAQASSLIGYVQSQVPEGDYLVIGGDFNTGSFTESALSTLSAEVDVSGRPDDQRGTNGTNASRARPYDQVLPSPDLSLVEVPVAIGGHGFSYSEGLVFDSRVFTPLSVVRPVLAGDSGASGMQHMAVIRDFLVPTAGEPGAPMDFPGKFVGTPTSSGIRLTWTDSTSAPLPDGYLIKASSNPVITPPLDGFSESNDSDLSDGLAQVNVAAGVGSFEFSGLPDGAVFYFEIHPYTTGGAINYKDEGRVPSLSVLTIPIEGSVPPPPILGSVFYPHSGGFTMTWNRSVGATGYRIDVSTVPDFVGSGSDLLLSENFDASDNVPLGWVNQGTEDDSVASHYKSAGNCRALGPGDSLETPAVDLPAELSFYVDASGGGDGQDGTVSYSVNGGAWQSLAAFTATTAGDSEVIDLSSSPNLSGQSKVRFRFESTFFTWYLDDVVLKGSGSASLLPEYDDRPVGDADYFAVNGLDPDTDYFFRVRAENGNGSSADSTIGSEKTRATGTPYSVWASDLGIAPVDLASDFDSDGCSDYEEYLFATDPTSNGSGADRISIESRVGGLGIVYRRSIAPGLTWEYLGGGSLPIDGLPLASGSGYSQYQIDSVVRLGNHEVVSMFVNTGADPAFFFKVKVTP